MIDFDALPEIPATVKGLPTPASMELEAYFKTLGDGKQEYLGVETGIANIDKATMGLSGVIALGGVAGKGKTTLALQIAYETAKKGTPVIFYSLEMPKRAIYTKILSRLSRLGFTDISLKGRPYLQYSDTDLLGNAVDIEGYLTKDEATALREAHTKLMDVGQRLYIRSREAGERAVTFKTVEEEIALIKAVHNAERVLVVVDHLQVFNPKYEEKEYIFDQIDKEGKLIDRFKKLSDSTNTPVLLITQLNKQAFGRDSRDKSVGMEGIKGSVDIVYLADIVMALEGGAESTDSRESTEMVKLTISKNRYNAPGELTFLFDKRLSDFTSGLFS